MSDLTDVEIDGFALLAEHTSAFVRGDRLGALVFELRRLRAGQLTGEEARVLRYAASIALATETDPASVRDLGAAIAKLMILEITAAL